MIGQTLSHYEITAKLGEGGMGEVWRATDMKLGREVALKILPSEMAADSERLERFRREAQAIAALNHPNIVTVYSVEEVEGIHLLTMELVEGRSLDRILPAAGLDVEMLLRLAVQIADGLAEAHAKGIVHRDLKPANVMVTDSGRVKVLDFGLAKLVADPGVEAETELLTQDGTLLGTVPYMSPEQVQGKEVDLRTDIFSLGVLLYEMATGRRPFQGDNPASVISALLKEQPPSLVSIKSDLPRQLARIVHHCLEKDPRRRFQSALDLRNQLEMLSDELASGSLGGVARPGAGVPPTSPRRGRRTFALAAAAVGLAAAIGSAFWLYSRDGPPAPTGQAGHQSVAVLPLLNLGADESIDYLRLAIPDEITTVLSRAPAIATRPFSMSASYQSEAAQTQTAGKELGVATIITGQYFREGTQIQLTLEAIDVEKNVLVWRESVRVAVEDMISLRQRVANRVRRQLLPALGSGDGRSSEGTRPTNRMAYDLFLRSLAVSHNPAANRRAIEMLERVVAADPDFAPAWASLASRYHDDGAYTTAGETSRRSAVEAANRALELDPELTSARIELTLLRTEMGEIGSAYREAEKLVELRPRDSFAHFLRSYLLRYAGLFEESKQACDLAISLDPAERRLRSCARAFFLTGKFERAGDFMDLDPGSEWVRNNLAVSMLRQGREQAAQDLLAGGEPGVKFDEHTLACLEGWPPTEHDRRIREMEAAALELSDPEQHYWTAGWLAYCGGSQAALRLLRRAVDNNYCATEVLEIDPLFESLRKDSQHAPLYREIVAESVACQKRFLAEIGRPS